MFDFHRLNASFVRIHEFVCFRLSLFISLLQIAQQFFQSFLTVSRSQLDDAFVAPNRRAQVVNRFLQLVHVLRMRRAHRCLRLLFGFNVFAQFRTLFDARRVRLLRLT